MDEQSFSTNTSNASEQKLKRIEHPSVPIKIQNMIKSDDSSKVQDKKGQKQVTKDLIKCKKNMKLHEEMSEQMEEFNYKFCVGEQIVNSKKEKTYRALELLGIGTFGQVLLVQNEKKMKMALKVYKKQPAYISQGLKEVKLIQYIGTWQKKSKGSTSNYLNIYDAFPWKDHLCVAMQLMDSSLLDILTELNYEGVQMKWIEVWAKDLLFFLAKIHQMQIFHCDIKPENIMFRPMNSDKPILIDFNSSCTSDSQPFSYFQSRHYRSPEVIFGIKPFSGKIDIWSLGCVLAELYLGLPLFPGASEYDQVQKIYQLLHNRLPDPEFFQNSLHGLKYFRIEQESCDKLKTKEDDEEEINGEYWQKQQEFKPQRVFLKRDIDFEQENKQNIVRNKGYDFQSFEAILEYRNPKQKQLQNHELFLDLLKKMLVIDPNQRISAEEAFIHPFIGGMHADLDQLRNLEEILPKKAQ